MTDDGTAGAARRPALLFGVLAVFQAALAAGAPWGVAAWGGANPGVLPTTYRVASGASAAVWTAVALALVTRRLTLRTRQRIATVLAPVMVVAALMNGASPSRTERALWTPFAVAQVLLLAWFSTRRAAPDPETIDGTPVSSPRRGSSAP